MVMSPPEVALRRGWLICQRDTPSEPEGVDGWTEMGDFFQSSFFFRFVQCHVSDQLNLAERQSRKPEHDRVVTCGFLHLPRTNLGYKECPRL